MVTYVFLSINAKSGLLAGIWRSFVSQNPREFFASHSSSSSSSSYYYYYYYCCEFVTPALNDGFSFQVSQTLLSILADLNYAVAWMVSLLLVLRIDPCAPFTIDITLTFRFHGLSWFFDFHSEVCLDGKFHFTASSPWCACVCVCVCVLFITRSGLGDPFVSQNS